MLQIAGSSSIKIEILLIYFIILAVLWSVIIAGRAMAQRDKHASRLKRILRWRAEMEERTSKRLPQLMTKSQNILFRSLTKFKILRFTYIDSIRLKLIQGGYRSREAVPIFLLAKLAFLVAFTAAAYFAAVVYPLIGSEDLKSFAFLLGSSAIGFFLPDILVANSRGKRFHAFQRDLPDALDLMIICAEAGLSLDATLNRVAEELTLAAPALADEFALTAIELTFFPDRRQALLNLGMRCKISGIQSIVSTLIQTERYGTPLSQALRVLSADLREKRMLRAEQKAARLPAILTVPMIVFILPSLFIVLIGPALIDVYDSIIAR